VSKLELIRALYDYNKWANNQVLDAASRLSDDELTRSQGASFDSIEQNMGHIVAAQMNWLERWTTGKNVTPTTEVQKIRGLGALREAFARSHERLREFVASLNDERLDAVLEYRDSRGARDERPLWQLMSHVTNHGTHHRAETAMAMAALGKPVRELDYVYFELERAGSRS
jgi:uncharacterized damage-inducible protein DinB